MVKHIFRKAGSLILLAVLFISCGPSLEEKARKIALRDSAAIDSALKKEEAAKRAVVRHEKFKKDSARKAAHDSLLRKADTTKTADTSGAKTAGSFPRSKHRDSLLRVKKRDSIARKHISDTFHPGKRFDSAAFNRERRLHKRNALDSLHKRKPRKPRQIYDTTVQ